MRWLWSRPVEPPAVPPPHAGATRFEGMDLDEVRRCGTGLYEVTTSDGVPVNLHDMDFVDMTYRPTAPPSLVLRFLYVDAEWTPDGAAATPMAVFTFSDVVVLHHEDDPATEDIPAEALRLVQSFDYDEEQGLFALSAYTTFLVFTASSVTLALEPAPG